MGGGLDKFNGIRARVGQKVPSTGLKVKQKVRLFQPHASGEGRQSIYLFNFPLYFNRTPAYFGSSKRFWINTLCVTNSLEPVV